MRSRVSLILLLGLAIGCGSSEEVFAGELTAPVVYGEDDRVEVFNHPDDDLRSIARESIVALIPTSWIERGPDGTYALAPSVQSLGELHGLCPDELFVDQPAAAVCLSLVCRCYSQSAAVEQNCGTLDPAGATSLSALSCVAASRRT